MVCVENYVKPFIRDKEKDLNVKGAYLHMMADAIVSVGAIVKNI